MCFGIAIHKGKFVSFLFENGVRLGIKKAKKKEKNRDIRHSLLV